MSAALALLMLSSGCALRPVVRGEVVSLSWEEADAALPGGGGGHVEAPLLGANEPAAAEPAAPQRRIVAGEPKSDVAARETRVAQAAPAATLNAPAAGARVPVTVRPKDESKHYEVTAPSGQKCTAPCTLDLAPGDNLLSFGGDTTTAVWVKVPQNGGTLQFEFAGNGRRVASVVLVGAGSLVIAIGAALTPVLGGIPLLIMAGVGLVLLIPGIIIGATGTNTLDWVGEPAR